LYRYIIFRMAFNFYAHDKTYLYRILNCLWCKIESVVISKLLQNVLCANRNRKSLSDVIMEQSPSSTQIQKTAIHSVCTRIRLYIFLYHNVYCSLIYVSNNRIVHGKRGWLKETPRSSETTTSLFIVKSTNVGK